jgi:beta-galactosidase
MRLSKRFLLWMPVAFLAASTMIGAEAQQSAPAGPDLSFPTVLYGAAYYNEYMPGDDAEHVARLEKDVALMKAAGLSVVRMGESTWSLWEPEDGKFEYAWMDRVVDAMGKAGIKVILGTPIPFPPGWPASILKYSPIAFPAACSAASQSPASMGCGRTWIPTRLPSGFMPSA